MPLYRFGKHIRSGDSAEQTTKRFYTKIFIFTMIAFVPFIVYIYLTIQPPSPVTGKTINKGFYDPFQTFSTDWFTFRVDKGWEEVPELTKPDSIYTYRQKNGQNPQGLFRIYVNNNDIVGGDNHFTNVLPVRVNKGNELLAQALEPDCTSVLPPNNKALIQDVSMANTTFKCWPGTGLLYAVAGEIGGGSIIGMKRANGDDVKFIITYRNLGFTPSESTFTQVLSTFKSK